MNKLKTVDKAITAIHKLATPYLTNGQWQILRDHLEYVYVAGYEQGWADRTGAHSYRPLHQMLNGQVLRTFNTLDEALHAVGGTDKKALSEAARGKARRRNNKWSYKGYNWIYADLKGDFNPNAD